ncbi:MAG TPA: GWxTD domain-containing protein [Flavipsychrobacter sp.]|nr:GWxTD domain-containing protein [Flavipsychrobacter sp.]
MSRWIGLCFFLLTGQVAYGINALPAYTVFYLPSQGNEQPQPYIELYWQIDPATVRFAQNENGIWLGKITTTIDIVHDTGIVASEKYYLQTTPAASLRAARLQNIMDMHRYVIAPGKVNVVLTLSQEDGEQVFRHTDSIKIDLPQQAPFYSSLQLLDTTYKTALQENIYYKNGNLQVPSCINFLDDRRTIMHYYTELHGTDKIPAEQLPLKQYVFISKKEYDHPVFELIQTDTLKPGQILPMLGRFKIDVLPSGNYHLNIVLKNNKGIELAKNTLFFQRSNANPVTRNDTTGDDTSLFEKVSLLDLSTTFAGAYSAAQLKAIMKMLKPIADQNELLNIESFAKRPDETYMRYFVYNFWKARLPDDPEKGWKDFTKKVKEVNKLFGSSRNPGYETERGFYYLKYGPPDQRYVVTAEEAAWPYEIWQYNAPGKQSSQGVFLFYNPGFMVGDYKLLHSTVQGEMRNNNWRAELYKSGGSSNNLNSRAEQILRNQ